MAIIKFKSGEISTIRTEQIKVMQRGKLCAPFGLAAMRECEIIEYVK
ncbi:hypothetical protein MKK42_18035 [Escherichia coli]|nr:hypothetical protein [Escherichia coli]MCI2233995.1 hypothetical protein [Escherichia coli]